MKEAPACHAVRVVFWSSGPAIDSPGVVFGNQHKNNGGTPHGRYFGGCQYIKYPWLPAYVIAM